MYVDVHVFILHAPYLKRKMKIKTYRTVVTIFAHAVVLAIALVTLAFAMTRADLVRVWEQWSASVYLDYIYKDHSHLHDYNKHFTISPLRLET